MSSSSSSSSSILTPCLFIFIFLVLPLSYATSDSKIPVQSEKLLGSLVGNVVNTAVTTPAQLLHDNLCKTSPDKEFCKKLLNKIHHSNDIFFIGRFIVKESAMKSKRFLSVIDALKRKTSQPAPALDDCQELALLNEDFVALTYKRLKHASSILPRADSDDVETRLSTMLTNQQTCMDSMDELDTPEEVKAGVLAEVVNDRKLFGMSLSIFQQGWAPPRKNSLMWKPPPNMHHFPLRHGAMSLKMSKHWHHMFEKFSGRRHLDAEEGTVKIAQIVAVKKDGTGNFTTISQAVEAAPKNNDGKKGYFMIYVSEGVYEEYVMIPKHKTHLMIIGDGIGKTIITGSHSNRGGWTTYKSATLAVVSPNFVAVNITVRNTAGPQGHQAVAVRNSADLSTFYMCSFEGYQDTLYAHSLRQFYRECDIYGTIDYIFGNAEVVFQSCNMYSRLPMAGQSNAVTAQGRVFENQNTGTSIINCTITAAPDLKANPGKTKTYLGRPWKQYSRTLIMNSYIDAIIDPSGWELWNETFALETLYYGEYNNRGPGASTKVRVMWPGYHSDVDQVVAANFTVANFIDGDEWLPMTGVPYQGGLL